MNPAFFPGPIDAEAVHGLALHAARLRAEATRSLSRSVRKEIDRCLRSASPAAAS